MTLNLPPLREYQRRAVDDIRAVARELAQASPGYGILAVAPTGAGKTRVGLELAMAASGKAKRALWLAPRNELVEQPVARLRNYGFDDIRTIYGGVDEGDPGASITVASIQTLLARGLTPPADVVILDEARHYVADEWSRIAGAYLDRPRVGLDATPARADGKPQSALFDRIVPVSSVPELIDLGFLVPARIIGPPSYSRDKGACIAPLDAYLRDAPGRRSLLFCASKAEAKRQAKLFCQAGVDAVSVDAHSSLDQRRVALERLRAGDIKVLVNVMLYTEGLDLVELEHINISRGLSHPSMWVQIGGRGLRPAPHIGKTECVISDNFGHFHRRDFGPLDDPREYSLEGRPLRTAARLPGVVQCRECLGWRRGSRCPCGAKLPAPPKPRLTKRDRKELRHQKALASRNGPRWAYYVELVRMQRERDYKPGWVGFRFQSRFGHFPPWRTGDVDVPLEDGTLPIDTVPSAPAPRPSPALRSRDQLSLYGGEP